MGLREMLKGWFSTPVVPPNPRSIGPQGGPASQIPGGEVFSDQDPYLSGGMPLIPKDGNAPPRQFQYQPGYNLAIQPRSTESVSFTMLRQLAEATLVRIVIEHLKCAIKAHEWDITTDEDHEKSAFQGEILSLKKFLEKPDRKHAWDEWVGLVCEEALVIDALSIYRHKNYDGSLSALEVIDGSTIKVLIDTRGFVPSPPTPAYQQFLYGTPKSWYTEDEMIYAPMNRRANKFYGFSPVEQLIVKINETMRREFSNLAQFTDGNTPAGIATLPKEWSLEQIKGFDRYFNEVLSGNSQRRSKLFFGPEGMAVHKFNDDETFGLFSKYDEWLARVTCFTFGVSPMPFITLTNRAAAQEMGDVEAEGGVALLKMFIERILNKVIAEDFATPHLRFNWITDRSRLQEKRVKKNVQYASNAIFTPNEIRLDEGKEPLPGGDLLYFSGAPLGMGAAGAVAPSVLAPVAGPASEGDGFPARPELPDGARPVIAAAGPYRLALQKCMTDELNKWERFALNRYDEGRPLEALTFDSEYLPSDEIVEVTKALSKNRSRDRLKHLFDTRRANVRAMRIEPPNNADAAGHASEMKSALRDILTSRLDALAQKVAAPVEKSMASIPRIDINPVIEVRVEKPDPVVVNVAKPDPVIVNFSPTIEAAKAVVIPAPKVDVVNKVSPAEVRPADIINRVEVAPTPPASQPIEKARRLRKHRILRDSDGNMTGIEEVE